jgi:hypothetical protein
MEVEAGRRRVDKRIERSAKDEKRDELQTKAYD